MFSMFHLDMNESSLSMILWTVPLYIIIVILLVFGPFKGIIYVLQGKEFHYLIISKWTSKYK
ncbi:hypothetical protein BCSAG_53580 [Bacillus cereus]|nr:hypothetical protein C0U42_27615 [Bacillus cereus]TNO86375.1 hypothetical protein FHR08_27155 [Bacillus cereus]